MLMTNREPKEYERRLCISYLDEAEAFETPDIFLKSIVSLTSLKSDYIKGLERDWKQLRIDYKVPVGVYLHFTDIKNLLKENYANHNPVFKGIFGKSDGTIDYTLIYKFYNDILSIIDRNNFVIQATGIEYAKETLALPNYLSLNTPMYQLFYEHLDRMAFYLIHLGIEDLNSRKSVHIAAGQPKKAKNESYKYYFSKLRYDGSYDLQERNDYRNAYSHCISDGTKHFGSQTTKEVFDTLRFVAKSEVGLCTNCNNACDYELISHAGDELVDFIALYVARDMWRDYYRKYMIEVHGKKERDIDFLIEKLTNIEVPDQSSIKPIHYIRPKLFITKDISEYKLINDYPF